MPRPGSRERVADLGARGGDARRFFDDPEYLRIALAERTDAGTRREAREAARLACCAPGALILDAGCGHGRHALALARAGYRVVAVDRSAVLLGAGRRAANGTPWPRFVHGRYSRLPFPDGRFDAVLNLGTALGYGGEAQDLAAVREFRRVLARGGRLVIETAHRAQTEPGGALAEHEERLLPSGGALRVERRFDGRDGILHELQQLRDDGGWGPRRGYAIRLYTAAELDRLLARAGFGARAFHGSLAGRGAPGAGGPLVIVASVR